MTFLLFCLITSVSSFDPFKINYCNFKCGGITPSVGCNCYQNVSRNELVEDVVTFRQQVLEAHNILRNKVARGDLSSENWNSSANMYVLNYDLELEHLARCAAYIFNGKQDKCRKSSFCQMTNPSQLYCTAEDKQQAAFIDGCLEAWSLEAYDPSIKKKNRFVDNFYKAENELLSDFSLLIWAKLRRLGCARIWDVKNPTFSRYVMICNYAGYDGYCTANVFGEPIYKRGSPCTQCGEDGCNKNKPGGKFEALCGEVKLIPSSKLPIIPIKKEVKKQAGLLRSSTNNYKSRGTSQLLFGGAVFCYLMG